MDKVKYLELISSYLEGELSPAEIKEIEKFISDNPNLSKDRDCIEKIINILGNTKEIETSRNFMIKLNEKIDKYESKSNRFRKFLDSIIYNKNETLMPSMGISLSIAIIFISSFFIYKGNIFNNRLDQYAKSSEDFESSDSLDVDRQKIRLVGGNND